MDVEMKIRGLVMDPATNMPIVILKDVQSETVLPIWVGLYEANAIALEIEKSTLPRPMTHDLLRNLIHGLKGSVQKVVVTDLRNDTFYAVIWMEQDGEVVSIDARPSDALALALRSDCPIYVSEEVIRIAKLAPSMAETSPEELRRWLEGLNDEDLGPLQDVAANLLRIGLLISIDLWRDRSQFVAEPGPSDRSPGPTVTTPSSIPA